MYRKMLIPLDRSELGEKVLPYATEICARLGLELTLINVISQEEHERASTYKPYLDGVAERLLNKAHYVQRSTGLTIGKETVRVQTVVTAGNPPEEILHYSEQNKVDLILMATHGRSGIGRWALGSVADKVLRKSKVPVWLVRAGTSEVVDQNTWSRLAMLVPLDGSQLAESVLPHVETLAGQRGVAARVVLIRVSELPVTSSIDLKAEHEQYMAGVRQRLASSGLDARSEILVGEPARQIIEYANENPINLIVMATHGRSEVGRWAYGSVADRVLRRASHSIFLVRAMAKTRSLYHL